MNRLAIANFKMNGVIRGAFRPRRRAGAALAFLAGAAGGILGRAFAVGGIRRPLIRAIPILLLIIAVRDVGCRQKGKRKKKQQEHKKEFARGAGGSHGSSFCQADGIGMLLVHQQMDG